MGLSIDNKMNGSTGGLTLLDRSVSIVLKNPDETASRREKISSRLERLHRIHGTSLICEASTLLCLSASSYATACTIFHRFYQQVSLSEYDVWSVALASVLLSTKVEEEPQTLKTIIHAFCHIYRKRILVVENEHGELDGWNWNHSSLRYAKEAITWTLDAKEKYLSQLPLPSKLGPVFEVWHKQALDAEAALLRQVGFTLYWIPDSHPHKFILYFCQALGLTQPQFTQQAWNYCNDSCRLDLCIRFPAEIVATSSILLAARDFTLDLPMTPYPWWETFVGKSVSDDMFTAANAILGLCNSLKQKEHEFFEDAWIASRGYVVSCVKNGGSFLDPNSFLWEHGIDAILVSPEQMPRGEFR